MHTPFSPTISHPVPSLSHFLILLHSFPPPSPLLPFSLSLSLSSHSPVYPSSSQVLSEEEYSHWLEERHAAEVALEDREKLLFQSACSVEKNLELLGEGESVSATLCAYT